MIKYIQESREQGSFGFGLEYKYYSRYECYHYEWPLLSPSISHDRDRIGKCCIMMSSRQTLLRK